MSSSQAVENTAIAMTSVDRDRWWLENVYRGNAPQMTIRAVLCGFVLGGLLSAVNLYIGAKTGFSLGTSVTAVVLAYALFSAVRAMGLQSRIGILENNIVQSIACSGGYMSSPLMASMAAYMIVTNTVVPWWQMVLWMLGLSVLGVVFAIPLKRLFINDEQSPFPEGQACGVVLQALHGEVENTSRSSPARALLASAVIAGLVRLLQAREILALFRAQFMAIPERIDGWYYELAARNQWPVPTLAGAPLPAYTMRLSMDVALVALGGLIGMRTCLSLLIGAVINYAILAPAMVARGDIESVVEPDGLRMVGFRSITRWSLWCGVAIMTTASLWSFAAQFRKSGIIFRNLGRRRASGDSDLISHIEMPISAFFIGAPCVGLLVVLMANQFFGVHAWMAAMAIPMVLAFTIIAVSATAQTSITPHGPLGKLTQLAFGGIAPGNTTTNIATAGISAEVAFQSSNLIQNMKPGYMLGAKPRLQAIGHLIGALAGALVSVPVFYSLLLRNDPSKLVTDRYPFPAAEVWRSVAEALTRGLGWLPTSAIWAACIGATSGIGLEICRRRWPRNSLSPIGIGLAFVIPFDASLGMFAGAFAFWIGAKVWRKPSSWFGSVVQPNHESICSGLIAGAALMGLAALGVEAAFG